MTDIRTFAARSIAPIREKMGEEAARILDELFDKRDYGYGIPIDEDMKLEMREVGMGVLAAFQGDQRRLVVADNIPSTEGPFRESQLVTARLDRFLTMEENRLYCRGTKNLLYYLTHYSYIETPKCTIVAVPEAAAHRGKDGVLQAFIEEEQLDGLYGKERAVFIYFILDDALICLGLYEDVENANRTHAVGNRRNRRKGR